MTAPTAPGCRCGHPRSAHPDDAAGMCTAKGCECLAFRPTGPARGGQVYSVPLADLYPNPKNPRRSIGDINDLVESITERGVLQPLLAMRRRAGGLTVLAGHRRLAAAQKAGLDAVPVLVVGDKLPDDQLTIALAENLHRLQLSPMDEARACQALLDQGRTRKHIADELARSGNWVADRLALLELPVELQRKVDAGKLPVTKAAQLGHNLRKHGSASISDARAPFHFTKHHDLAEAATTQCDGAQHPIPGRIGPACGRCWESVIRADERRNATSPREDDE